MAVLSEAAGLSSDPVRLSSEQMKQMIEEVHSKGDAARGELVFRHSDMSCYQCHAIAGAGGWLAPDLSSIGATAQLDYLINSVLDPNKDIKDGYDGITVLTKSGDVYSGIKVQQDSQNLVLRDNEHQAITIPLADVKAQKSVGSLMPSGLASPLTHQEFLDLIEFLSQLGKPGPYGPSTAQFIRRWQLSDSMSPGANWASAYSLLSGDLPADSIVKSHFARGGINVTAPGKLRLLVNDTRGLDLWVDAKPVSIGTELGLELARGVHALTFRIDPQQRGQMGLRSSKSQTRRAHPDTHKSLAGSNDRKTANCGGFILGERLVLRLRSGQRGDDPHDIDAGHDHGRDTKCGSLKPTHQSRPERAECQRTQ